MKYYKINNAKGHCCPILCCHLDHHCFVGKHVEEEKQLEEEMAYVKTHPEFHLETRGKSCGDHLQGKFTEELGKSPLKMDNPNPEKLKNTFNQ